MGNGTKLIETRGGPSTETSKKKSSTRKEAEETSPSAEGKSVPSGAYGSSFGDSRKRRTTSTFWAGRENGGDSLQSSKCRTKREEKKLEKERKGATSKPRGTYKKCRSGKTVKSFGGYIGGGRKRGSIIEVVGKASGCRIAKDGGKVGIGRVRKRDEC